MLVPLTLPFGILLAWANLAAVLGAPTCLGGNTASECTALEVTGVMPRALGDAGDPINAFVDCTGLEQLCDADCYAILCENQPQVLQRVRRSARCQNYRDSGASYIPFNRDAATRARIGVTRPDSDHISAEEYPFESSAQGGRGANLFPATRQDQSNQGTALSNMYRSYNIDYGQHYKLNFDNANTVYCNALAVQDYSVCNDKTKGTGSWGFDFAEFDYTRSSLKGQAYSFEAIGKQHISKRELNDDC